MWYEDDDDEPLGVFSNEDEEIYNLENSETVYPDEGNNLFETYIMANILVQNQDLTILLKYYLSSKFYYDILNTEDMLDILKKRFNVDRYVLTFSMFLQWTDGEYQVKKYLGCYNYGTALIHACQIGSIDLIKTCLSSNICNHHIKCSAAVITAKYGYVEALEILLSKIKILGHDITKHNIQSNLNYFEEFRTFIISLTKEAAQHGQLEIILLLKKLCGDFLIRPHNILGVMNAAIIGSNIEVYRLLYPQGHRYDYWTVKHAVRTKNKEIFVHVVSKLNHEVVPSTEDYFHLSKRANDEIFPLFIGHLKERRVNFQELLKMVEDQGELNLATKLIDTTWIL